MVLFPHAKINLGLNVVHQRPDGYHEVRTVMLPIPLCDILEAVVDATVPAGRIVLERSGRPVPGAVSSDLVARAWEQLARLRDMPGVRAHLHKVVPIGSGLGGGSSDGTHMLLLLNELLHLGLASRELHDLATRLGSDTAFFLEHGPCFAQGRGELLKPIALDVRGLWLVLVDPGIHCDTAEAYRRVRPSGETIDLIGALARPLGEWRGRVRNELAPGFSTFIPSCNRSRIRSIGPARRMRP